MPVEREIRSRKLKELAIMTPVGTVCFGWSKGDTTHTERLVFQGDRQAVREQTLAHALAGLLKFIE